MSQSLKHNEGGIVVNAKAIRRKFFANLKTSRYQSIDDKDDPSYFTRTQKQEFIDSFVIKGSKRNIHSL